MAKERMARLFLHYRTLWLVLFDMSAASLAWLLMVWARVQLQPRVGPLNPVINYIEACPYIVLTWVAAGWLTGLYDRRVALFGLRQVRAIMVAVLLFAGSAMSIGYLTKNSWDLGRSVVIMTIVANALILPLSRIIFEVFSTAVWRQGYGRLRTAIIGSGPLAETVVDRLGAAHLSLHHIVGYLAETPTLTEKWEAVSYLGSPAQLAEIVSEHRLDEVCFADPSLSHAMLLNTIAQCHNRRVRFRVASSDLFQVYTNQAVDLEEVDGIPVVHLANGTTGMFYHVVKRGVDLVGGLVLLIVFSGLLPIVWLALRGKVTGSCLFCQNRVGLYGRPFVMYKFRTMYDTVDEYEQAPVAPGDHRVIPGIGEWLRKTSLDEIPQCLNVLRGDMGLVGPRPEMPFIAARYQPWQQRRLTVKPGITGLWQILGRKDLPLHSNLEYDFYYIHNQSLWLDLSILLKTIPVVLFGKGAY